MRVWPGSHYPLGATYDGNGTNFSVFSEIAERVELCLFDSEGNEQRFDLREQSGYCWHGYLPGVTPGQMYGFRVHGPWRPAEGHRCNPAKLLLDPYAKAIEGKITWHPAVMPYRGRSPNGKADEQDSAGFVPKSVVHNSHFDWRHDRPPNIPLHRSVIYELHVKGFTQLHPHIPPELRGTFAGLAQPVVIDYLVNLGVTAVELMPVQQFVDERRLVEMGLRNYWGYNTIGYFAPHNQYCVRCHLGEQVQEFKEMVRQIGRASWWERV